MSAIIIAGFASQAAIVAAVIWTSRAMRRDLAAFARETAAATHRSHGRCGQPSPGVIPGVVPVHCDLPFGHLGWHKSGDGHSGVATEWSQ